MEIEALEELYRNNYGIARSTINERFLNDIPKRARFLEVGCNTGNQLVMLSQMGWKDLSVIELQPYAIELARKRLPAADLRQGSAMALPWEDSSFEVVFTSGVLIHIAPENLPQVMNEIHRTSKEYIWGFKYYAPEVTEVAYRTRSSLLGRWTSHGDTSSCFMIWNW